MKRIVLWIIALLFATSFLYTKSLNIIKIYKRISKAGGYRYLVPYRFVYKNRKWTIDYKGTQNTLQKFIVDFKNGYFFIQYKMRPAGAAWAANYIFHTTVALFYDSKKNIYLGVHIRDCDGGEGIRFFNIKGMKVTNMVLKKFYNLKFSGTKPIKELLFKKKLYAKYTLPRFGTTFRIRLFLDSKKKFLFKTINLKWNMKKGFFSE